MSKNLKLYGKEYCEYTELLSLGNVYYILISKRLLIKPMMPIWAYLLALFLVRSNIFFAMVGLPSLIVFSVFLASKSPASSLLTKQGSYIYSSTVIVILVLPFTSPIAVITT